MAKNTMLTKSKLTAALAGGLLLVCGVCHGAAKPGKAAAKKQPAKKAAGMPSGYVQMTGFEEAFPVMLTGWKMHEGDVTGAEAVNLDDSAWQEAEPGFTWKSAEFVMWFRKKFTLPASTAGKQVYFDVMASDLSELFVDGRAVGRFGGGGRGLLTEKAVAGKEYSVAIKVMKSAGKGAFMFAGWQATAGTAAGSVRGAVAKLSTVGAPDSFPLAAEWKFAQKSPKEAESPGFDDSSWETVTLSHTWKQSKPTGWYRTVFTVPEKINGFDVAGRELKISFSGSGDFQVYVNGVRGGKYTGSGAAVLTDSAKPGEKISVAFKLGELTGKGRFDGVTIVVPSLTPLREKAAKLTASLEDAALLFEQHPKPEKAWVDAGEAAVAGVEALAAAWERTEASFSAALDEIEKHIAPLKKPAVEFPPFLKGPYLQNVAKDAVTVMWQTPVELRGCVLIGAKGYDRSVCEDKDATIHEIRVTGLKTNTVYHYAALSGKIASPDFTFHTAVDEKTPFTFNVWGDNRTDYRTHQSVITAMMGRPRLADIALNVGDVVSYGAAYDQWGREYFLPMRSLAARVPTYIAIGNHEYGGFGYGNKVPYFEQFVSHPAPNDYYYAFTYGNSRFIALNPQENACCDIQYGTKQYEWMISEFESAEYKKAKFHFVFLHEPPYSDAWSGGYYDGEAALRADLVPLLEKYGVDIVFSGHTHDYERGQWPKGKGPYYIITGGGGSSLDDTIYREWEQMDVVKFVYNFCEVSIDGGTLKFNAVGRDGKIFDGFEIRK